MKTITLLLLVAFWRICFGNFGWKFPLEIFLPAPCISPPCRRAVPLLDGGDWWCIPALLGPGVQGEGEGGADGDRELEVQPLASQRLAEVHALGVQGEVEFAGGSHFSQLYLNL